MTGPEWLDPTRPHLIHPINSLVDRLDYAHLFLAPQPVELELGSGDGSFIAEYARRHPEINFIGVERLLGRARKIERKALRAGLVNLRILRIEAAYLTQYLLPPASLGVVHIYFPDPWPKKKHHKNRLINERFTGRLAALLRPGGLVHVRTDDTDYFEWIQAAFAKNSAFAAVPPPPDLLALKTDFEVEFNQRGIPTRAASYRLV